MKNLNVKKLENYFLVLSAQEDNLNEFKKIQDQITEVCAALQHSHKWHSLPWSQIHHEIKALATLDNVSDDEVFQLSAMASHVSSNSSFTPLADFPRRRFHSVVHTSITQYEKLAQSISMTFWPVQSRDHYPISKTMDDTIMYLVQLSLRLIINMPHTLTDRWWCCFRAYLNEPSLPSGMCSYSQPPTNDH